MDVEGTHLTPVGEPDGAATGHVVTDFTDRPNRVLERHVAQHDVVVLEHPQHAGRGTDLDERGVLAHVGVPDDHVEPAVLLGIGVWFVAGVDDRPTPRGRRRHPLPDVFRPLRDRIRRSPGRLQHLSGAGVDLAADEERDQDFGVVAEVVVAIGQVVLVAAVRVASRVGVVLEQVDRPADRFLGEALLGRLDELFEDPLPRLVVDDEVVQRVTLGRRVLGVRADVEIEPGAVLQEHVRAASPGHHPAEQVAGDLVGAQPPLSPQRAGDPVLVLEAIDPTLHQSLNLTHSPTPRPPPFPKFLRLAPCTARPDKFGNVGSVRRGGSGWSSRGGTGRRSGGRRGRRRR